MRSITRADILISCQRGTKVLRRTGHDCSGGTVIPDALKIPRDGREIVWQTGVGDSIEMCSCAIRSCQLVQVWSIGGIADNLVGAVVLHHDIEDMLQARTLRRSNL